MHDSWSFVSEYTPSVIPSEVELQATCLNEHALFGLFIAITVWVSCDLLMKIGFLIKKFYRGVCNKCPKRYDVEQAAGTNSSISDDYVTGATSIQLQPMTSTPRPIRAGTVIIKMNFDSVQEISSRDIYFGAFFRTF